MFEIDPIEPPPAPKPRTFTMVIVLLLVLLAFSYLIAFALTGALISEKIISPFMAAHDPRPRIMCGIFGGLLWICLIVLAIFRWSSRKQLSSIDALSEAEDPPPE
jgi:hypothetical protein